MPCLTPSSGRFSQLLFLNFFQSAEARALYKILNFRLIPEIVTRENCRQS